MTEQSDSVNNQVPSVSSAQQSLPPTIDPAVSQSSPTPSTATLSLPPPPTSGPLSTLCPPLLGPLSATYNLSTSLPLVNTSQATDSAQARVTLPLHPPFSPPSATNFLFQFPPSLPLTLLTPVISSTPLFARDSGWRDTVITPNLDLLSRDQTLVEAPVPDPHDGFGLLRSRTPSIEWDNYAEELQFGYDQDWKQRKVSTDPNILESADQHQLVDIGLDSSEDSYTMEDLNREISRLQTLRGNLLRRINMFTPDDVTEDLVHEIESELKTIHDIMDNMYQYPLI